MSAVNPADSGELLDSLPLPSVPPTPGPFKVDYCQFCGFPPEYCEFSSVYTEKCRPWIEKNLPELLLGEKLNIQEKEKPTEEVEEKSEAVKSSEDSDNSEASGDDDEKAPPPAEAPVEEEKTVKKPAKTPQAPQILISKSSRSKNKYITSIVGMDLFPQIDLKKATKSLSKKFACSASVVKIPPQGQEIQIQGDCVLDLPDYLCAPTGEFKFDRSVVYFIDKAGKKTKAF